MRNAAILNSNNGGFTLIEILVAATILAVLAGVGMVSYSRVNQRSRDAKRKSDIEQLRSAMEMYRADNGYYPDSGGGSWTDTANLNSILVPAFLPAIPSDPQKTTQTYRYQATDESGGNYYGYCLTAYLEAAEEDDSCTPDSGSQPTGTYMYGVKSP